MNNYFETFLLAVGLFCVGVLLLCYAIKTAKDE